MHTFTEAQVDQMLNCLGVLEHDNHGQLVIYTGIFRWHDGTFHDSVDPELEDDPTDA